LPHSSAIEIPFVTPFEKMMLLFSGCLDRCYGKVVFVVGVKWCGGGGGGGGGGAGGEEREGQGVEK
jgi:hypothetical protein